MEGAGTMTRRRRPSTATRRLARLERACTELWHREPEVDAPHRSRLLRQLAEIERWITSTTLRLTVDPDGDPPDDPQIDRYERRLDGLVAAWSTPAGGGADRS